MGASASVCVGCRAGSITAETVALAGGQPAGGCRGGCRRTVYRFLMCQWPGRGCRLGDSSSVGGVFLIFTLLFLPPAPPQPSAPHRGVWQQYVEVRVWGGGVWVGCAWGVSACTSCASAVCKAAVLPPHFGGGTVPWVVPLPPSPGWKVWRHGPWRGQGEMAFASLCLGIPAGTPNLDPPHRVPAFLGFTKRPCRVVGVPGQGWWWWGSSGCLGGPQGSTTEPQHPSGKGQPGQSLARHGRPGRLPAGLPLK